MAAWVLWSPSYGLSCLLLPETWKQRSSRIPEGEALCFLLKACLALLWCTEKPVIWPGGRRAGRERTLCWRGGRGVPGYKDGSGVEDILSEERKLVLRALGAGSDTSWFWSAGGMGCLVVACEVVHLWFCTFLLYVMLELPIKIFLISFWPRCEACGFLILWSRIEPMPYYWKCGQPEKPLKRNFFFNSIRLWRVSL